MRWLGATWAVGMIVVSPLVPGYRGDISGGGGFSSILTIALIAGLVAFAPMGKLNNVSSALLRALPAVALLAAAAIAGFLTNEANSDVRGEPIYLYFGIAWLASWFALIVVSAGLARPNWSSLAGLGITLLIALLGYFGLSVRID